jgi:hypothetical protein
MASINVKEFFYLNYVFYGAEGSEQSAIAG